MKYNPGQLYRTKTDIVFFNRNIQPGELQGFDRSVKIPKNSIVLLLDIQPTERYAMFTVLWDNKVLKREIHAVMPASWIEEVDNNVLSSSQ